jgi:hypothetical protein
VFGWQPTEAWSVVLRMCAGAIPRSCHAFLSRLSVTPIRDQIRAISFTAAPLQRAAPRDCWEVLLSFLQSLAFF